MKRTNRLIAMLFCLGVTFGVIFLMAFQLFRLDLLSWISGIAIGWALRDTFEPIEEKELENNAEANQ